MAPISNSYYYQIISMITYIKASCEVVFLEDFFDFFPYLVRLLLSINIIVLLLFVVILNDLSGLVLIGHKPLFDAFDVVVTSATSLTSLQQTLGHHLLAALKMQNKW